MKSTEIKKADEMNGAWKYDLDNVNAFQCDFMVPLVCLLRKQRKKRNDRRIAISRSTENDIKI